MPKKKIAKKLATKVPTKDDYPFKSVNQTLGRVSSFKNFKSSKKFWLIVLIVGLLVLGFYKKSWFVAAMVNGQPITNLELQKKLNDQFRTQTLNQMINEKILLDQARKTNNLPSEDDINKKITDLQNQVGGKDALDSVLSQQGQTLPQLKEQVRLQLIITRLYQKEATVSADEVDKYIQQNASTLQATDSAKQKEEAYNLLQQQKLTQIFNQKFQELRSAAKIQIF